MSAVYWALLALGALAVLGAVFLTALVVMAEWREWKLSRKRSEWAQAHPPVGDDTIAMLCLVCNGARSNDCICTSDCGYQDCQAGDPEEARHA